MGTGLNPGWFTIEPERQLRPQGYPWDLEVRVALPLPYANSDASYPVLWVTDNDLESALPALAFRNIIVVGVGHPRTGPGYDLRRAFDFYPEEDILPSPPFRDFIERRYSSERDRHPGGGSAKFLNFLVDELRPQLASRYRMQPDGHALEGYSGGGWFVCYALFSRPGAFAKYIAGAPSLYFSQGFIWKLEEQHAANHDDLAAELFLGAGDGEMTDNAPVFGCFSSMARMAEILTCRAYPSLQLTVKVFPGETHISARPMVIGNAVRALWGDSLLVEDVRATMARSGQ